jgi:hypothetical protein
VTAGRSSATKTTDEDVSYWPSRAGPFDPAGTPAPDPLFGKVGPRGFALGLKHQREALERFAHPNGLQIVAEFTEIETGKTRHIISTNDLTNKEIEIIFEVARGI